MDRRAAFVLTLATALPAWLSFVAVWLIEREERLVRVRIKTITGAIAVFAREAMRPRRAVTEFWESGYYQAQLTQAALLQASASYARLQNQLLQQHSSPPYGGAFMSSGQYDSPLSRLSGVGGLFGL